MPNPLYQQFAPMQQMNDGGFSQMIQQINYFRQNYRGNARQEVERLMQSGQMSQSDFNKYSQMANQIMKMM
jgi:hypothetical protein